MLINIFIIHEFFRYRLYKKHQMEELWLDLKK